MREWSIQQNRAISEMGCSLLVSAGAGSGKTAVLVERIIRLVIQGVDLDKFLVVTFTQAAAGEMRERISEAILERLDGDPDQGEYLRRQLYLLKSASISTIHSFCTEIIRNYFYVIGIDPQFKVADENEARLIKNEALEELLEFEYEMGQETFSGLAEMYSGSKNDQALADLIERLHSFVHSLPEPWKWLEKQAGQFGCTYDQFLTSSWVKQLMQQIRQQLYGIRGLLDAARNLIQGDKSFKGYLNTLDLDMDNIQVLLAAHGQGPEGLMGAIRSIEIPRLGRAAKDAGEDLRLHVKSLRDEAKNSLVKLQKALQGRQLHEFHQDILDLHPYMQCLTRLVNEFQSRYRILKAQKNLLDFNDLEHQALRILSDPQVSDELRDRYSYIFVDEYQDSNMVQEYLIQSICGDDNLFLVGDIKQSIYRFRLADPSLFLKKYREYPQSSGNNKQRIDLLANYRSDPEILHAVNTIFRSIMSEDLGEMDYDEESFLYTGWEAKAKAMHEKQPVKVTIIEKNSNDENDDFASLETAECEARLAGLYIQESLGQPVLDPRSGEEKCLEYRDMVVLLRATQKWGHIFWETFTEMGIPVYADINTGYFDAIEVKLLLNLLRIIDNKQQDIPLLSTMRSSIGGFTIEEMAEIRVEQPRAAFFDALSYYANNKENELAKKASQFISRIKKWQERANFLAVDELIWEIMLESGYLYYVSALPGGQQRQGNVKILLDRARQFQSTTFSGLYHFINYLEKVESSSGDLGVARTLGENDDLVRIMSIHKSKGLEFPLVIVPGLGKKFNTRDTSSPMLLHRELGLGPRFIDLELRCYHDTLPRQVIRQKIAREGLSEEMRILYVAMTRARNRLFLMGTVPNLEKSCSRWIRPLDAFNLARAGSFLDWLGPVLIRNEDGEVLRKWLPDQNLIEIMKDDESRWQIELFNMDSLSGTLQAASADAQLSSEQDELEKHVDDVLIRRLKWVYPWQYASQIPSKLSATQIRKMKNRSLAQFEQDIPALTRRLRYLESSKIETKRLSPAERGTLIHFIMQKIDLGRVANRQEIEKQIEDMFSREIIDREYAEYIDVEKLWTFFKSELGQRVIAAKQVFRELPFNLLKEGREFLDINETFSEPFMIQGVIDMCFIENDEIVLLDYKTDSIFEREDIKEIVEKYRPQLEIYCQALETLMNRKVKETYLYLFSRDSAVGL